MSIIDSSLKNIISLFTLCHTRIILGGGLLCTVTTIDLANAYQVSYSWERPFIISTTVYKMDNLFFD